MKVTITGRKQLYTVRFEPSARAPSVRIEWTYMSINSALRGAKSALKRLGIHRASIHIYNTRGNVKKIVQVAPELRPVARPNPGGGRMVA